MDYGDEKKDRAVPRKINTKRKFVADGVFQAELNDFLARCLGMEGYAGIEVRVTNASTEIRVRATKSKEYLEKKEGARKVRELISLIQKRFNYSEQNKVELSFKPLPVKALCSAAQCENVKYKLLNGIPVRMAANGAINQVMRTNQAKGCEVIISGKVRGQRAKAQKYRAGYLISTGQPKLEFVDEAVRHVQMRQGVLGIKVKIFVDTDRRGRGKGKVLPDKVEIIEPKEN